MRFGYPLRIGPEFGGDESQEGGTPLVVEMLVGAGETGGALPGRDLAADTAGAFVQERAYLQQLFAREATRRAPFGEQRPHTAQPAHHHTFCHLVLLGRGPATGQLRRAGGPRRRST
ncbi:MAG: hypothetical protein FAZ92_02503 [Accumulibacter sp.]|nr:MAG: hypothetical protein FAZ92_02503 [Accumulibacter sp.]